MIYLVEIEAFDPTAGGVVIHRFSDAGYTTGRGDVPAHEHYHGRLIDPGDYSRSAFSPGRTTGWSSMNAGVIELANADGGLDRFTEFAVDGRAVRICTLQDEGAPFGSRALLLSGLMDQIEVTWSTVTVRLRDRMAVLSEPLQSTLYAGTTTAGGMNEAEGTSEDLKGKPKPLLWGRALNLSPVQANRFDLIFQVSSRPLMSVDAVRDKGVALAFDRDFPTIDTLRAAAIPNGRFATCLARGLIRTQREPAGDLTADARSGHDGQRSAAMLVRAILEFSGFVEGRDFLAADFAALHAANSAEVGTWSGTEPRDRIAAISDLLASVGAWIVPDALGRFRVQRLEAPVAGPNTRVITKDITLDEGGDAGEVQRLVTEDEGRGVPAKKVTVRYAFNRTVQPRSLLDTVAATDAVKAFAPEEWRNAVAEAPAVSLRHLLAPELSFDTAFVNAADAQAEANRRLALYATRRERYQVKLSADEATGITIGVVVILQSERFGLGAGKPFVVLGETVELADDSVTFDLWG